MIQTLVLLASLQPAQAAPTTVVHEGRLLDSAGAPLNGTLPVLFQLFPSEEATTAVWQESLSVQVQQGYYAVVLGNETALDDALLSSNLELWLGIQPDGQSMGRQQLHSVPFAIQADHARTLSRSDCEAGELLAFDGDSWECTTVPELTGQRIRTYERWGRTSCPAGATEVYDGWMLTGYYAHSGGPSNYFCAVATPEYDPAYGTGNNNQTILYQVEIESSANAHPDKTALHNYEARCAVCEVAASEVLTIAMARSCPAGWSLQYEGFIMGNRYDYANANEAICVDRDLEGHGASSGEDGGLLHFAEWDSRNSALPYTNNREVSCVVCSK